MSQEVSYLITFFGGLISSLLVIWVNNKIRKSEKPEKYLEKIYEKKCVIYEGIISKLSNFVNYHIHTPLNFRDTTEYEEIYKDFGMYVTNNSLYISEDLFQCLHELLAYFKFDSDKDFKAFLELRTKAIDIMRKELGLPTIHNKFIELFPEMENKEIAKK